MTLLRAVLHHFSQLYFSYFCFVSWKWYHKQGQWLYREGQVIESTLLNSVPWRQYWSFQNFPFLFLFLYVFNSEFFSTILEKASSTKTTTFNYLSFRRTRKWRTWKVSLYIDHWMGKYVNSACLMPPYHSYHPYLSSKHRPNERAHCQTSGPWSQG